MLRFRRFALFIFASAITLAAGSAHAALAVTTTTYNFVGACTDCNGFGRAELTLSNYTPGQAIDATNFIAFHYDGTDLLAPFTITAAQATSLL